MHLGLAFRYPGKHNIYFISLKKVNPEMAHCICTQRVKKKVWNKLIFDHNHHLVDLGLPLNTLQYDPGKVP